VARQVTSPGNHNGLAEIPFTNGNINVLWLKTQCIRLKMHCHECITQLLEFKELHDSVCTVCKVFTTFPKISETGTIMTVIVRC
jgi:hypothetical protein